MKYALVDQSGIVQNLIEYDGSTPFTPPEGQTLSSVNDWINPGDNINAAEPAPPPPAPPAPPAPTKAELLAQIVALTAQVNALPGA